MCLTINKDSKRIKATTDIICYKAVCVNDNGEYITYYNGCVVNIGSSYKSYLRKYNYPTGSKIEEGLHSFTELEEVLKFHSTRHWVVIIQCQIPKGSYYYEGKFGSYKSYASNQLKYVELIKTC